MAIHNESVEPSVTVDIAKGMVALEHLVGTAMAERLHALPDAEREVIVFAYLGGYNCRELAAMLHRPSATVTGQIRSGLDHLRGQVDLPFRTAVRSARVDYADWPGLVIHTVGDRRGQAPDTSIA
ncbi:MAG TPA: sigma factor-like helix-turn-helix DNA-binding protein [Acidimicrobiales bacterium]